MRYKVTAYSGALGDFRNIVVDRGDDTFTSFPAEDGNPNYASLLESQGLTDAEVQAMTPDEWHDMA